MKMSFYFQSIKIRRVVNGRKIIPICTKKLQESVENVRRPYRKCLDRFLCLFYEFINFYGPKYPKLCQNWSKLIEINICSHMIKRLIVYVNYDSRIMSMVFVDHIEGVLTGFWGYYKILARFMVQNIQNYIKVDHDWSRWRYEFMIKRLILHVHYDSGIMSGAFSDHIGGV